MRRLLVGLVLALAVTGCQGDGSGERSADGGPGASTTTVGQQALKPVGAPSACTARSTTALLKGFFAALSAGRVGELDAFFAPASRFKWYANGVRPGLRLNSSARDRASLLGYLQRRQAKHERIKVDAVDFNGYRASDRTGHFGMLLRRTADDIPGGPQLLGGKGAVDCDSQRLMVVAIGVRP
jgi:Prokaryotic membrane lipoprotein lipid attachment site